MTGHRSDAGIRERDLPTGGRELSGDDVYLWYLSFPRMCIFFVYATFA